MQILSSIEAALVDEIEEFAGGSYGISLEEGKFEGMKPGRRIYYSKNSSSNVGDLK